MGKVKKGKRYIAVVQSARSLFWKYGIKRVTVEEICKEAGVSKMTFYRNFSNKQDLAIEVLRQLSEEGIGKYRAIMGQDIPFAEKVKQSLILKYESAQDISVEFLKDVYQSGDKEILAFLENLRRERMREVMNDFQHAQEQGWIRQDLKLSFILHMLNKMHEHMMDEHLMGMYSDPRALIMDLSTFFFYGILPRESI